MNASFLDIFFFTKSSSKSNETFSLVSQCNIVEFFLFGYFLHTGFKVIFVLHKKCCLEWYVLLLKKQWIFLNTVEEKI